MAPLLNFTRRPFQPTIASFEMIGWRTEHDQSHPFSPVFDNVTEDSANYGRVLEVMFLSQKLVEPKQIRLRRQANRQVGQKASVLLAIQLSPDPVHACTCPELHQK